MNPKPFLVLSVIFTIFMLPGVWVAQAQDETPEPDPESLAHAIGPPGPIEVDFPEPEAVAIFVRSAEENPDGSWVTYHVVARRTDGSLVTLTPCDDLAIPCLPITSAAIGGLEGADAGDRLVVTNAD